MPEIAQERLLFDHQMTYIGGGASNNEPSTLRPDQFWWGRNVVVRDGFPKNRPGVRLIAKLPDGKMQGGCYYKHSVGSIGTVIAGTLYRLDIKDNAVSVFEVSGTDKLSGRVPQVWMVQAGPHLIAQDGMNHPVIHDGSTTWRAIDGEVPVGTCMAFGNARLWVANRDSVLAGDIYGLTPESHLQFTETTYLATGGAFVFPEDVTALGFLPRVDAVTEQGELMVFTKNSISALRADIYDRSKWLDTPGMQRVVFPSIGCEGQRNLITANTDMFFRSDDGLRSVRSTFQENQHAGKASISPEAEIVMKYDTSRWLKYMSGVRFDNRLLLTGAPKIYRYGDGLDNWVHVGQKIVSLDLVPYSTLGSEGKPAFDGEWTGLNIVQLIVGEFHGKERCFALCVDCSGVNTLWEISRGNEFDLVWPNELVTNATERARIPSYVEFRRMLFDRPFDWKSLERMELWFSDVFGPVDWEVSYRTELDQNYTLWQSGQFGFGFEICDKDSSELCAPVTLTKGSHRLRLSKPPDIECSDNSGRHTRFGREFQVKVSWTGRATLKRARLAAQVRDEALRGDCQ